MEYNTGTETLEGLMLSCRINARPGVRNGAIVQRQESSTLENIMVAERCKKVEEALNSCSLAIHGRKYQCMKQSNGMLSMECRKPTPGSGKHTRDSLDTGKSDCHTLSVLSGPCFRPWSRGRKGERKDFTEGDGHLQEHQRHRNECFRSHRIAHELHEIVKGNSCRQVNGGQFICLSTPCKILESPIQGEGLAKKSLDWVDAAESELQTLQSTRKIPAERKDDFLNARLLRRKLISFYDHGSVIQPFEAIVGETLNHVHVHRQSEVKFTPGFQQGIFPFAVPYFRLPLLPTSRQHLGRISEVLKQCEPLPWQLQDMTSEYKRQQSVKPFDIKKQASNQGITHDFSNTEENEGKKGLQVFIPTE